MSNELISQKIMPATTPAALEKVRRVEELSLDRPQIQLKTSHTLHAGIYTRVICVPAGVMITGALIKIPTTLTVSGECLVLVGEDDTIEISGFAVIPASAGRKQVFVATLDTYVSMSFKTKSKTVAEAEAEFTDEVDALQSRSGDNDITITED